MPRRRTESAIRKSQRTESAKEEIRLRKAKQALERYRLRYSYILISLNFYVAN